MSTKGTCACGRSWTGLSQAHCRTCHGHFGSVNAFDLHRPARTGCGDPATLKKRNSTELVLRAEGGPYGVTWVANRANAFRGPEEAAA